MKAVGLSILLMCAYAFGADAKSASIVDSGEFSVVVSGKKVASENFTMQQGAEGSSVNSRLTFDNGTTKAQQESELELAADGAIRKYTWQEKQPGKARLVAEPQDKTFIIVHLKESDVATSKDTTHPLDFTMTSIVDDNFYSHVQVLLWRYFAMSCTTTQQCKFEEQRLPVFVPHQEMAQTFTISFEGTDTLRLKTGKAEVGKYRVQTEGGEMHVWMLGTKMVKLLMPAASIEVTRE
jgi:hypothetical protein